MPSLLVIRRRIRSIRNTAKITKAMELVAASRLRRAQMRVTAARPYADAMRALVAELGAAAPSSGGALNTNIIRRGTELILQQESADGRTVHVVTVGRKGQDFLARRGRTLLGT